MMEMATARRKSSLAFSSVCGNAQPADEDSQWLSWAEKQFCQIAGEDRQIDEDEFKMALNIKKSFFAERFFHLFDQDGSGYISLDELMEGLYLLTKGDPVDKLRFLFSVYDVDGNGAIDHEELKVVLRACLCESSMTISEATIDALTSALFEAADTDGSGAISFEELKEELEKNPDVMENLTISAASWLKPPSLKPSRRVLPRYLTWRYVHNNYRKILFLVVFILINVALFTEAAYRYAKKKSNWCLITARGCGQCLNFNSAFVLVLMLRKTITTLRTTKAAEILPTDQNIVFHKLVGIFIALLSGIHTLGHIGNAWFVEKTTDGNVTMSALLFTNPHLTSLGLAPVSGSAFLTGWVLDIILAIMVICSMPFVRRSGHFQVFYFTHMLYVVFWGLLLIHGPRFWYWFVVPGIIFIVEKLSQTKCVKQARYGKTYVQEVNLLPSGVTHLALTRPNRFHYKAGDYIFINIPQIAQYEWHPFTISSAPEQQGTISMHIRSAGNWTNRLYAFFEDRQKRNRDETELLLGSASDIRVAMETEEVEETNHAGEFIRLREMECDAAEADVVKPTLNHRGANGNLPHGLPRGYSVEREESEDNQHQHRTIACQTTFEMKGAKSWRSSLREEKIQVFIDGPYGTATRGIFQAEHAILVGAGIGVTPFASILQSIMHRYRVGRQTCPICQHTWLGNIPTDMMRLKKVDFIWINRNQNAFEWFVSLLTQLEMEQAQEPFDRFLELHMYMTSAMAKNDMKGIGLQMALDIMHKKGHRDLITGLKTRTQPGRPDWNKIFTQIAREKKGKVQVFFCGSPTLAKIIKKSCEKFNFSFHKENF
ncbi:NADPH oxidase 5 [Strongylocentrotus purpuratus]|uniref:NADPH oxidase 5 n=1 Tax=Strongylocentrotus purpuratus TaxID=7668 RepID=A0A7M7T5Q8_STRPU|nr:NADPH oxidase 5-like [Strongylocentrotus purpuratus]XP_030855808.1 NADPH oxidase 5 [Strongylocentrotus purpuratus]|eukprot:XP_003728001.1 PREDICTED: NADPH oxidase 5 [Strongylocentrotus purpuratus]